MAKTAKTAKKVPEGTSNKIDKKEVVKKKPKLKTTRHTLIKSVVIGDTLKKVGETVDLTEQGKIYFKSKYYIK